MEIVSLVIGILFIISGFVLSIISDDIKTLAAYGFGIFGTLLCIVYLFTGSKAPRTEINQSELTDMKITMTIINNTDTICDTTYTYEPKR